MLRTFGVLFGKRVGGFTSRADEIISGELGAAPEMRVIAETLMKARASILDQIKVLDRRLTGIARRTPIVRLFMTAPGVGAITALSVASAFDDASRFKRSSSAGAYLGLTPRRYESGETSRNGRISKQGNKMTRKHLYEAATTLLTRNLRFSTLKAWGMRLAEASGFKKARIAVARKMAVILHAMWKTNTPFRWSQSAA
jgi:transposase